MGATRYDFGGQAALVTGAGSGIGRATALRFADAGAAVLLADIDPAGAALAEEITHTGGRAVFVRTDVSRLDQCEAAVSAALATFGRLDCAFNNAGVFGRFGRLGDLQERDWQAVLNINLGGVVNCMHAELKVMAASGGAIVNNASVMGLVGGPLAAPYVASKHGVIGLTRAAAMDYGRKGVRVNAVCPGFIRTPMTQGELGMDTSVAAAVAKSAVGRLGEPDEIADAVLWLCSTGAAYVHGAALAVDGGFTAN